MNISEIYIFYLLREAIYHSIFAEVFLFFSISGKSGPIPRQVKSTFKPFGDNNLQLSETLYS